MTNLPEKIKAARGMVFDFKSVEEMFATQHARKKTGLKGRDAEIALRVSKMIDEALKLSGYTYCHSGVQYVTHDCTISIISYDDFQFKMSFYKSYDEPMKAEWFRDETVGQPMISMEALEWNNESQFWSNFHIHDETTVEDICGYFEGMTQYIPMSRNDILLPMLSDYPHRLSYKKGQ